MALTTDEARKRLYPHCRGPWQPDLSLTAILDDREALAALGYCYVADTSGVPYDQDADHLSPAC